MAISLTVILISMFAIFLFKKEIENITNRIELNNKLEANLKRRTELFSVIENDAKIIGNNDALIEKAFIPSNNISEFINALDSIVNDDKIKQTYRFETPIQSTTTDPINTSSIPYTNNINLNISELSTYLKNFEKLPYFTKIESLNISAQNKSGWKESSSINFKASLVTKTSK